MHNYYEKCIEEKRLDILIETTKHFLKRFVVFLVEIRFFGVNEWLNF